MSIKTKKTFKSLNDIYNSKNYFWKHERYIDCYRLIFTQNKPQLVLYNDIDKNDCKVIATGLKEINKTMKLLDLEVEI